MHDLTKIHVILILVDGQKSHSQMSLEVKRPAVNCHLWSNVTCGQMSLWSNVTAVKCHLRSNVPRSNVTVVKCHKFLKWSKVRGQMSCGQMRLWS